ncbi:rhodanese-like domain-containing protein [Silvibacterium acidisoli]|uniref:rhodanese-like domain-containing protein n=1 Tax=Acidobacteriaceae bacterium ZG23-2 TaxID=2883246 RepID=UPI00406D137B
MIAEIAVVAAGAVGIYFWKQATRRRHHLEYEEQSVSAQELHEMLQAKHPVKLYDVRLPLDLLADSEIIPGATRLSPSEIKENPYLIPQNEDSIVYCTCASEETSREIAKRAKELKLTRIRFLRGGLEGWKAAGYSTVPYNQPFHLDTPV